MDSGLLSGIAPLPARADVSLPWDSAVADPVTAFANERALHGDTFGVASGGQSYLFVFSPVGVASFYALTERDASKGIADWRMLRRKVPDELFAGRRTLPGDAFGRRATAHYVEQVGVALRQQDDELGPSGEIDVFALTRRLGHRIALANWGPPGVLDHRFDELVAALDQLDGSEAFVDPVQMLATAANDRADERQAMESAVSILIEAIGRAEAEGAPSSEVYSMLAERWSGEASDDRLEGIALDIVLLHIGSMSNLFAALGWTIVHLLAHPDLAADVTAGDMALLEKCCLESVRVAQRSIMMREVLQPVDFDAGDARYRVDPGVTIATLLPLTNTTAGPGLDTYDPRRWNRRRLAEAASLAAPELVTTFGHGEHSCPALPFSLAAMTTAVHHLLTNYELSPQYREAQPRVSQIGGVARAEAPCIIHYRQKLPTFGL